MILLLFFFFHLFYAISYCRLVRDSYIAVFLVLSMDVMTTYTLLCSTDVDSVEACSIR